MRVDTLEGPCEGPAGKKPSETAKKKKLMKNVKIGEEEGLFKVRSGRRRHAINLPPEGLFK